MAFCGYAKIPEGKKGENGEEKAEEVFFESDQNHKDRRVLGSSSRF